MGKARKIASIGSDQSKEQKRGHQRRTEGAKNGPSCFADGHLSSQECGVGTKISYDHVCLGCTQRQCKSNESIIEENKKMFESRISARATEKVPVWETSHAKTVAWSCDLEGHAKKCVEGYFELAKNK